MTVEESEIEPVNKVIVIAVPLAPTESIVFVPMPFTVKSAVAAVEVTVSLAVRTIVVVDVVAPETIVGGAPSVAAVPAKLARVFPDMSETPPTCAIVGVTPVPKSAVYVSVTTLPATPTAPSVLKAVPSEV